MDNLKFKLYKIKNAKKNNNKQRPGDKKETKVFNSKTEKNKNIKIKK